VLFYSLTSFLSAGILGGSTAKNKKTHLCDLRGSAVKTIKNRVALRQGDAPAAIVLLDLICGQPFKQPQ